MTFPRIAVGAALTLTGLTLFKKSTSGQQKAIFSPSVAYKPVSDASFFKTINPGYSRQAHATHHQLQIHNTAQTEQNNAAPHGFSL